jgi:hypothetical protein
MPRTLAFFWRLPTSASLGRAGLQDCVRIDDMRIAGVRLQPPVARLLSDILEGAGHADTSAKIVEAVSLQITVEAPLTAADYQAILDVLNRDCPPTLYRLHRELLDDQRYIRRVTGT